MARSNSPHLCRVEGYSTNFTRPEPKHLSNIWGSSVIFSGSPGKYRLHYVHSGKTMAILGISAPKDWVLWDTSVPANDDREVLDVEWLGNDDDGNFKIRGHDGEYVKWAEWEVSGFTSSGAEDATEFILREV